MGFRSMGANKIMTIREMKKSLQNRHGFIYVGTEGSGSRIGRIGDKKYYTILHPICQIERYSGCSVHNNSFVVPAVNRRLLARDSGGQPLGAQSSM